MVCVFAWVCALLQSVEIASVYAQYQLRVFVVVVVVVVFVYSYDHALLTFRATVWPAEIETLPMPKVAMAPRGHN